MDFLDRFASSPSVSDATVLAARNYIEWQTRHHTADFIPSADDDVELRTYLFHLHTRGTDRAALEEQVAALKQFYQWAQTKGVITHNPFDEYNFAHPFVTSVQMDPRPQTLPDDLNEREVERLRALSQIAEQLNSSVDSQSALDSTLRTLLKAMNLQTGRFRAGCCLRPTPRSRARRSPLSAPAARLSLPASAHRRTPHTCRQYRRMYTLARFHARRG
jgi:hypothetical protein